MNGGLVAGRETVPRLLLLLAVSLMTLVAWQPLMPSAGLDPSWMLGMNEAIAHKATPGRDLVFTFGPYASLHTRVYHPGTDALMIWGGLLLAVVVGLALNQLLRGLQWPWVLTAALPLLFGAYTSDALLMWTILVAALAIIDTAALPAMTGRARSGAHAFHSTRTDSGATALGSLARYLPLTGFMAFGLAPLVKLNLALPSLGLMLLGALALGFAGRARAAAAGIAIATATLLSAWALAGMDLGALPAYFATSLDVMAYYSEAMVLIGKDWELHGYLLIALVCLVLVVLQRERPRHTVALQGVAVAGYLYAGIKCGFVRHVGEHVQGATAMLVLLAVVLPTMARARGRARASLIVLAASVALWWSVENDSRTLTPSALLAAPVLLLDDTARGVGARLGLGEDLDLSYRTALDGIQALQPLGRLSGSVDLYSWDQAALIASGNQWAPRPVFQSYAAYGPSLAQRNREHLATPQAARHLLIRPQPVDERFPALDDGASWPEILRRYEPLGLLGGFAHLSRRAEPLALAPGPLQVSSVSLGQPVRLAPEPGSLLVRLEPGPSLGGRLAAALLRREPLQLNVLLDDGSARQFRLPSGQAAAGFVLSPFVETSAQFLDWAAGRHAALPKVRAFSLEPATGMAWQWQTTFRVESQSLPSAPSASSPAVALLPTRHPLTTD